MAGNYTIDDHLHRFSAWAAATAASASPLCRFSVEHGVAILEACHVDIKHLPTPDSLPSQEDLDTQHRIWCSQAIDRARPMGLNFSHGVAAKLINCYFKGRFVCSGHHDHPRVRALHPPIDAVLLQALASADVCGHASRWRQFLNQRWSKFTSQQYQDVINLIRQCYPDQPLWAVEAHWQGHQ